MGGKGVRKYHRFSSKTQGWHRTTKEMLKVLKPGKKIKLMTSISKMQKKAANNNKRNWITSYEGKNKDARFTKCKFIILPAMKKDLGEYVLIHKIGEHYIFASREPENGGIGIPYLWPIEAIDLTCKPY